MFVLESPWLALQGFFDAGGNVLWAIFAATVLMWALIVERLWYLHREYAGQASSVVDEWTSRSDHSSWHAQSIRRQLISSLSLELRRHTRVVQALMALLPLLGLLGTVTGMIQVFNVMAAAGTTNSRLMAAGVSAATIPTMSGLVAALSGLWFAVYYRRRSRALMRDVAERLHVEEDR